VHVPVQKMVTRDVMQCQEVIEDRGCWVNQAVQTSSGCTSGCGVSGKCGGCGGHKKSLGCGSCGHVCQGVTYACQKVWVSRPVRTSVPVKVQVQDCVTEMVAQKQEVEVPACETRMVPKDVQRTECVAKTREIEVPVTHKVARSVEEKAQGTRISYKSEPRTETYVEYVPREIRETTTQKVAVQVPYEEEVTTYVRKAREVKELITRQVPVQVPYTETVTTHVQKARLVTDMVERTVCTQVPYTETVQVKRMVPKTITKQVPYCETVWERQAPAASAAPVAAPAVAPSAQK
jgi:hypothetical protein